MRGGQPTEFRGTERFAVLRRLGAGGMGEVFEALDRERGERVALKTLRRLDAGLLYRLKAEFRALQSMHHPNLISLGELIEARGQWFFTMELIDGVDFVSYVRSRVREQHLDSHPTAADVPRARRNVEAAQTMQVHVSLPETFVPSTPTNGHARPETAEPVPTGDFDEERLRLGLAGVVEGLTVLHRAGLVHRDVKPSNVMVTREGRVVLLDFGLVQDTLSGHTEPEHHLIGTPAYMAPEQAAGGASEASDWYGLGVTLYQSLTGVLPFRGRALEVLHAKQTREPEPPLTLVDNVPEDLNDLCVKLLARGPEARPTGDELRRQICGDTGEIVRADPTLGAFVGRTRELAELRDAFVRSRSGAPVTVYVQGNSGMGKTALVERFLERLHAEERKAIILSGRCYERESVPFKALDAVIDSLGRYLRRLPHTDALALVPPDMPALARVFPVLSEVEAMATMMSNHHDTPEPQDLRGQAFGALKLLLHRLSERGPLVICIDDLQWGDVDSAALLAELLRPPHAPPMLLIACFRSDEAPGPVVGELERRFAAYPARNKMELLQVMVEPLSPALSRDLAVRIGRKDDADSIARAEMIARESAGNPFYLGEMLRSTHDDSGVVRLDEVIRRRMRELPEDARALLEVVAVVGRPIERALALRAAGILTGGDSALALLRAANLVRTRGTGSREPVEFFHDRIRQTVVGDIERERLHQIHQRIAAVLEASDWVSSEMLALAIQFAVGSDRERAFEYALESAGRAAGSLAFARAAKLYGLALELGPAERAAELHRCRADALSHAGHGAEAAAEYTAAAAGANEDQRLELMRLAADNLLRAGHIEAGLAQLSELGRELGMTLGRTRTGAIWSVLTKRMRLATRGLRYTPRAESELPVRELQRLDALFGAASTLGMIDHLRGSAMQIEHLLRALRLGEEHRVCRALETEAVFLAVQSGRAARRADAMSRDLVIQAERLGDPYLIGGAHLSRGIVGFFTGRYLLSHRSLREAERIYTDEIVGAWYERNTARYWLYMSQISLGDLTGVASTVERAIEEAEQRNDFHTRSLFLGHPTAWYMLREDRPDEADRALDRALEGWPERPYYQAHYVVCTTRAMVALYRGAVDEANERLREAFPIARALMIPRMPYVMGELHKLAGRIAVQRRDFREARRRARALEKVGSSIAIGLAGLIKAPVAFLEGDEQGAQRILTETIEHLDQCHAAHLAAAGRYRLGELRGGGRGEELKREATSWMRGQGVANIQRFVDFIVPALLE